MIKDNEKSELKKIIQKGFDIELISFELDIPLEEIQKIKQELDEETTNIKEYSNEEKASKKDEKTQLKMQQLRERYNRLYFINNQKNTILSKELSEEEVEIINSSITAIQHILEEMKDTSRYERRKKVKVIFEEINKVQNYQLTVEQAEQLNDLLNAKELQGLKCYILDEVDAKIDRYRESMIKKWAEAIDIAQSKTEDIEELKILERKTTKLERSSSISVGAIRNKIYNKITRIKQNSILEKIKNDIPENISTIINDLVNGTIDVEKANGIIKEEAKRRIESRPKTKFSITKEQEEKQILIQIEMAIREKADRFHITNPELTVVKLQELSGESIEQAIKTVVDNLISVKEFEKAKSICNEFTGKGKERQTVKGMRDLKLRIRNAEIGNVILKGINMQGTDEDERKYFELIEKGIKMGNVNLKSISLGNTRDGTRNITLADIWTDENEKSENIR